MLPLEPTDDLANPIFKDAASCAKWLGQLQLTNLNLAHSTVRSQLDELNRFPMRGKDRLQTLETMREFVNTLQADYAKKLFGKKLPLTGDEFTTLITLCNLWLSMLNGYLRCLQTRDAGDKSLASDAALLSHRCLLYSGLELGEFIRIGCEPDVISWQRFHEIYSLIEEQGLQLEPVTNKFNHNGLTVSNRTLYVKTLLLHRARLLSLTRNQWHIVDRWLNHWGDTFNLESSCSMTREDAPPLAVDLAGTRGFIAIQHATSAKSMRFLAMVPLSKLIRVKTILLQQGQEPQQNELGDELGSKDCIDLLNKLHACWCERHKECFADEPRDAPVLKLCNGLESIYAHISRKPFRLVANADVESKEAQKQIETFGRVLDQTDRHNLLELGYLSEEWLVEDDGLLPSRLLRKLKFGERLGMNQIVCVHKPGETTFKLGVVTLVNVTRTGQLYIGLRYLPGNPQAVVAHGSICGNLLSGDTAALVLPEMPKLRIPASILIPRDWFQSGRHLQIAMRKNQKLHITLGISVEKGHDYDRVSFTTED